MKSTIAAARAAIQQAFQEPPRTPHAGVVERIGPWFGPYDVQGIVILLKNDPTMYLVLRDSTECMTPVGLTQPGDEVAFTSQHHGTASSVYGGGESVGVSSFENLTLNRRRDAPKHGFSQAA